MGQLTPAPLHERNLRGRRATGVGRRIYDQLRAQMADGRLTLGAPLPSTRALAAELGVSRTTVSAVYDQLLAEGFIATAPGRVARVAAGAVTPAGARAVAAGRLANPTGNSGHAARTGRAHPIAQTSHRPEPAAPLSALGRRVQAAALPPLPSGQPPPIDFLYGAIGGRDFPSMAWRRAYLAALWEAKPRLTYGAPEGEAALRHALAAYLARARGLHCSPEHIVVVNGSQQAIDLCARLLLDAGGAFAFEDPGYLMARHCFAATGARALPVPVDEHGLDTRRLPNDGRVRLAYVTPSHQFPLGGTLPITRRLELLAWARRQRAWIVEDDYDGEFRYGQRPIDALASLDTDGRVVYIGTFSKALAPHLRLGYLVLPPSLVPAFRQAKRLTDRHAPTLEQRAMALLIDSGAYERHVRRMRREHERRRAALLQAVSQHLPAGAEVLGAAAGLHVVLRLPGWQAADEPALTAVAARQGVSVYACSPMWSRPGGAPTTRAALLVVGYASLDMAQIEQGMERLGRAIGAPVNRLRSGERLMR